MQKLDFLLRPKSSVKVEVDSNANKTVQSTKSADKQEGEPSTKKSDTGVRSFKISILSILCNQISDCQMTCFFYKLVILFRLALRKLLMKLFKLLEGPQPPLIVCNSTKRSEAE